MAFPVVIIGAGGFAREVAWLLRSVQPADAMEVVGFAEKPGGSGLGGDVWGYPCRELEYFRKRYTDLRAVIGLGSPEKRERIFAELDDMGIAHGTAIDSAVRMSDSVRVGAGTVICCGTILTVDIEIGRSVHINLDCTVGHDTVIEDFATIAPGAHISGNVLIGKGAYIGTGANIINGSAERKLVVGKQSVVGAGACVVRDVPEGTTVVGVPAREIAKRPG